MLNIIPRFLRTIVKDGSFVSFFNNGRKAGNESKPLWHGFEDPDGALSTFVKARRSELDSITLKSSRSISTPSI